MAISSLRLAPTAKRFDMEHQSDFVVQSLTAGEVWERTSLMMWSEFCSKLDGGIVLDIGAYTGVYSLLAVASSDKITVEAYEPVKKVFARLASNVAVNGMEDRITLINGAMSNRDGDMVVKLTGASPLPSGSSLEDHPTRPLVESYAVVAMKGDSVYAGKDVKLLKLDVERHEFEVLSGLKETLIRCKPVCFVEILDAPEVERITALMKSFGYDSVRLICEDLQEAVDDDRINSPKTHRTNYIFQHMGL